MLEIFLKPPERAPVLRQQRTCSPFSKALESIRNPPCAAGKWRLSEAEKTAALSAVARKSTL